MYFVRKYIINLNIVFVYCVCIEGKNWLWKFQIFEDQVLQVSRSYECPALQFSQKSLLKNQYHLIKIRSYCCCFFTCLLSCSGFFENFYVKPPVLCKSTCLNILICINTPRVWRVDQQTFLIKMLHCSRLSMSHHWRLQRSWNLWWFSKMPMPWQLGIKSRLLW